ncbi:metal tolerance protein 3 protein [Colletotrichum scovillei]|uniref:Metal tolerance protein 3 protein n=1 Tax=Colletotrichum scovillei TaxID=1209932 RepID=A0A9P7RCV1_9PEZI|nr:metal tolerance protein 3 protein [Colletotrichum scovillei]KAG7071980.1 metal tolerance protein 3 protein [Colletotrichum scovillei]KAG7080254.1 metal tolerance protein 3 protein [Colletotrichum scovillei]
MLLGDNITEMKSDHLMDRCSGQTLYRDGFSHGMATQIPLMKNNAPAQTKMMCVEVSSGSAGGMFENCNTVRIEKLFAASWIASAVRFPQASFSARSIMTVGSLRMAVSRTSALN